MRISPVTISTNYKLHSFKANEQQKPQQQEVQWSTWGDNYAFPIAQNDEVLIGKENTESKQNINNDKEIFEKILGKTSQYDETPEEYYRRKLYSTEWTM